MKPYILAIILSGSCFLGFIVLLLAGIIKRRRTLLAFALLALVFSAGIAVWTAYRIAKSSYQMISDAGQARTGLDMYAALFGNDRQACVKILHAQDQVIPVMDDAIWLHFKTCPEEFNRIISLFPYHREVIPTSSWHETIPLSDQVPWFKPQDMGDSFRVYEYAAEDRKNIRTLYVSMDSTQVLYRDIAN